MHIAQSKSSDVCVYANGISMWFHSLPSVFFFYVYHTTINIQKLKKKYSIFMFDVCCLLQCSSEQHAWCAWSFFSIPLSTFLFLLCGCGWIRMLNTASQKHHGHEPGLLNEMTPDWRCGNYCASFVWCWCSTGGSTSLPGGILDCRKFQKEGIEHWAVAT